MVHALLQVDCTAMCVVSACTQLSFNDKNPSSGFVLIKNPSSGFVLISLLFVFPSQMSRSTVTSHGRTPLLRLLIDSSVSTQTRPERAVIIDHHC